ncbi:hypothetical protein [Spiroplasma endosymbiont of Phyllotreta cruciferae]|uniref:hypothetical protein n=1 Tax=Spiroplasma endosymbiont of Phyllotreta cruciferae TaxID=2886375 RepID=UPI00209F59EA|nr:hypothetical protein [Spiroplasma endosymbiont of Phyllotreta cruciferae]
MIVIPLILIKNKDELFLEQLWASNKLPIVVGGSGLYINALLKNYQFSNQGAWFSKSKKIWTGLKPSLMGKISSNWSARKY